MQLLDVIPKHLVPTNDAWSAKKVFVTGGTGFLGSYLVDLLVHAGANVVVLDNGVTGCELNLVDIREHIDVVEGSITNAHLVDKLVKENDIVFHLASHMEVRKAVEAPAIDFETNVIGSHNVFDAVRRFKNIKKFVYASSCAVYGNNHDFRAEPCNPYGAAKYTMEMYGNIYRSTYNMPFTAVRLFSLLGPRMRQTVVFDLLKRLSKNPRQLEILGDGEVVRDFSDVRIAAAVLIKLATCNAESTYDFSGDAVHSITEVVNIILDVLELTEHTKLTYSGKTWHGDMMYLEGYTDPLRTIVGEIPKYDLRKGLVEYIQWLDRSCSFGLCKLHEAM